MNGSFYDFQTEINRGTKKKILTTAPDLWMGRTAANWAIQLSDNPGFDPNAKLILKLLKILDMIIKIILNKMHEKKYCHKTF